MSVALHLNQPEMTDAEWQARCDLAALYRIVHHLGWTDLINTHMSVRVPGEPDAFLINNYGDMFDEVTASSLVKMHLDGRVLGTPGKFNNAGFTIHSGVYKGRADANCVMHTHTRAGAGISLLENGIRPISQDALQVLDEVVYHAYGVPASAEECEELARSCAHGSCVVLLNHGLLTHAPTVPGALFRMYNLERACELELIARTIGANPVPIAPTIVEKAAERMRRRRDAPEYGLMEWQGLLRTIDRAGAKYRC